MLPPSPLIEPEDTSIEPTDADLEVAVACLAPVPWSSSPTLYVARIVARYRKRLEGEWAARPVLGETS